MSAYPDRTGRVLAEFRGLNTRAARTAFADHYIGVWSKEFDQTWPMVYELLQIIEEDELYKDPRRVGPGAAGSMEVQGDTHGTKLSYGTFAEYFEDRVRQPFTRWAELEQTYHYVSTYAPEVFNQAYGEAKAALAARYQAIDAKQRANQRDPGRPTKAETVQSDKNVLHSLRPHSGSVEGALRRLHDQRPDIHARVLAGELTAHAGMIEAGFRKPRKSRRKTTLDKILKLVPLLTNSERVALVEHLAGGSR